MAKRFTDTNKYKKPFIRGLQGAYKLLWDFLYHDCDHTGIWIVDFPIAQMYVGSDMKINKKDALIFFNEGEVRIIEIENGKKWFIPSFIEFQYGQLAFNNKAHNNIISILKRYNLISNELLLLKPLDSPLQGDKEQYKEQCISIKEENYKHFNQNPKPEDFNGLPDVQIGSAVQLIKYTKNFDVTNPQVIGLWNVFKIQSLTGKKFYQNESDVYSHFLNWIKIQKFENGQMPYGNKNSASIPASTIKKFNQSDEEKYGKKPRHV